MKTAVVTGAGSGVGRATALKMAAAGWNVALVARRAATLDETIKLAGEAGGRMLKCPCDIANNGEVEAMAKMVLVKFGAVHAVVNAAGTNTPERSIEKVSMETYLQIIEINMNGLFYLTRAFVPGMRQQREGTIVNVNSIAGKQASSLSGVAYVASKFGAAGLVQSINAEEGKHGIRACSVFPGDINTPLLDKRPSPPPQEARVNMLQGEDVAECVLLAINLPGRALVDEIVVRPR